MNDRFKFRVWDNRTRNYLENFVIATNGILSEFDGNGNDGSNYDRWTMYPTKQSRYEVEQCTGLKDKNGKLIYAGDVVSYFDGKFTTKVEYKNGHFYMRVIKSKENKEGIFFFTDMCLNLLKIIGNIHENEKRKQ